MLVGVSVRETIITAWMIPVYIFPFIHKEDANVHVEFYISIDAINNVDNNICGEEKQLSAMEGHTYQISCRKSINIGDISNIGNVTT